MDWSAIVWSGFVATTLFAAFFWVIRSLGWTLFSPTVQLGCLFLPNPRSPNTETLGFALLLVLGSTLVPAIYALLLSAWSGPSWGTGAVVGAVHGALTAGLLTFAGTFSACVRSGAIPPPGRFGVRWGRATPAGVTLGHAVYGAVLGAILAGF